MGLEYFSGESLRYRLIHYGVRARDELVVDMTIYQLLRMTYFRSCK